MANIPFGSGIRAKVSYLSSLPGNRTGTIALVAMVACLGIGLGVYMMAATILGKWSGPANVGTPRKSITDSNCLDEKGLVLNNEDGLLQYRCVDQKAVRAQGGDPRAVKELAGTIIKFNVRPDVPYDVLNEFEDRLTRSEMKYRAGNKEGVTEENVVNALNNLAYQVKAPDYARAYASEVSLLRENSRSEMPHFISPGGRAMSPLEAVYVLLDLIYQKEVNETFLLTPEEHAAKVSEKLPFTADVSSDGNQPRRVNPRVETMLTLVNNVEESGGTKVIDMGHQLLDDLGIER